MLAVLAKFPMLELPMAMAMAIAEPAVGGAVRNMSAMSAMRSQLVGTVSGCSSGSSSS